MRIRLYLLTLTILTLAFSAFASAKDDFGRQLTFPPTLPAPVKFRQAQAPITLANIDNIEYLGRLDMPSTMAVGHARYALSPDSTRLVILSADDIYLWNLLTGDLVFRMGRGDVTDIFFSSDTTEIYAITYTGIGSILDASSGELMGLMFRKDDPTGGTPIARSADGSLLAFRGVDSRVTVWNKDNAGLTRLSDRASAAAFSPDGEELAFGSWNEGTRIWHWRDAQLMTTIPSLTEEQRVEKLAFSPDGQFLAIGANRSVWLWSRREDQQVWLDTWGSEILAFSPDGRYLLAGDGDEDALSLWNLSDGLPIASVGNAADDSSAIRLPGTQSNTAVAAAFSPDGKMLLTIAAFHNVSLWKLTEEITPEMAHPNILDVGTNHLVDVAWTANSRLIFFFDLSGNVYLWGIGV